MALFFTQHIEGAKGKEVQLRYINLDSVACVEEVTESPAREKLITVYISGGPVVELKGKEAFAFLVELMEYHVRPSDDLA